jgi:cytochrome P450
MSFATVDHNLHKIRRAAISPYFSTANIRRLQPVMDGVMYSCLERIRDLAKSGEVIRSVLLTSAYSLGKS